MLQSSITRRHQEHRENLDLYLTAASDGWSEATREFLARPVTTSAAIESQISTFASDPFSSEAEPLIRQMMAAAINSDPELNSLYFTRPDGSFFFAARRTDGQEGLRFKIIRFQNNKRVVQLRYVDQFGKLTHSEIDETDSFDPTSRPWYQGLTTDTTEFWTDPYVFFSSQERGITYSRSKHLDDAPGIDFVSAADLRLNELEDFISRMQLGPLSSAALMNADGTFIAVSAPSNASEDPTSVQASPSARTEIALVEHDSELIDAMAAMPPDQDVVVIHDADVSTTLLRRVGSRWFLVIKATNTDYAAIANESRATEILEVLAAGVSVGGLAALLGFAGTRRFQDLFQAANNDLLTAMPNRRSVWLNLEKALKAKHPLQVAIIDLDNFKPVNDFYGHDAGDFVLQTVAKRISAFAIEFDVFAGRLGGDEFVVFGENELPLAKLLAHISQPIRFNQVEHHVTACIGLTALSGKEDLSIEEALKQADKALFKAKGVGGNRIECYGAMQLGVVGK